MRMPDDDYCELHAHSNFSFLDGASHPEELIAQAATLSMPALAVTDHAGLYAAVRLVKAAAQTRTDDARDAGLAPVTAIIGLELTIPRDGDELRLARRGRKLNDPYRGERRGAGQPSQGLCMKSLSTRAACPNGQARMAGRLGRHAHAPTFIHRPSVRLREDGSQQSASEG